MDSSIKILDDIIEQASTNKYPITVDPNKIRNIILEVNGIDELEYYTKNVRQDIKEYIEKYEPIMEKEKAEVSENSRRLENRKVLAPIIIEPEEPKEETEANIEPGKSITEYVIPACIDMIKRMDYTRSSRSPGHIIKTNHRNSS